MGPVRKLLQLVMTGNRFRRTPIADDDFPTVRDEFDRVLDEAAYMVAQIGANGDLPRVVCLCGSTRVARDAFIEGYGRLTDQWVIVLSVGRPQPVHRWDEAHKRMLDDLHKRKIDMCDEVFVLNVGGYVGESTRSEIDYARRIGRPVKYLEPDKVPTP